MKGKVLLLIVFATVFLTACGSDNTQEAGSSEIESSQSVSLETEESSEQVYDYEGEAIRVMANNEYEQFDAKFLTIDLPWADRRSPESIDGEKLSLRCNQRLDDINVEGIYIKLVHSERTTLDIYDKHFKESEDEIYETNSFEDDNVGETYYYFYRSEIIGIKVQYCNTYRYVFYDKDKNIVELTMQVPEEWETDCKEIISDMFKSIVLSEGRYPDNDFLSSDENHKLYRQYTNEGRYAELYTILKDYVENDGVKENDSAFKILAVLERVAPYFDSINANYDEVEDQCKITYKGIEDISSECHFVPIKTISSWGLTIKVGFINSDWIFFNNVIVTGANDNWSTIAKSYDKQQDVLNGGSVLESYTTSIQYETLIEIAEQEEDSIIRFTNQKDDKKLEYTLTSQEKKAAEVIAAFGTIDKELLEIFGDFNKYH